MFAHLECLAALGERIHQDATAVRILSLRGENLQRRAHAEALGFARPTERTGMSTTVVVVQAGEPTICLYYAGRVPAGENLKALLLQRQADRTKPLVMSDALWHHAADETRRMCCHCLAHGRRQCSDFADVFSPECAGVIKARKQVLDQDDQAHDERRSPEARCTCHQAYSRPIMETLTGWLDHQLAERLVAPNSALGKAMASMQSHWETPTRCVEIAGVPLENTRVERA